MFKNRQIGISIYWYYLSEARNLFKPDALSGTCIIDALYDSIELFEQALKNELSWRQLIEVNSIAYNLSSFEHKIMDIKIRCVKMVTKEAVEIIGTGKVGQNFQLCCSCQNMFCTWASLLEGSNWPRHHWRTVDRWHAKFCTHNVFLIHVRHQSKRNPLPQLLVLDNPDEAFAIRIFVQKSHEDSITVEKVHCSYILRT